MSEKVIRIRPDWALKAMLGEPTTNLWETRVTGYSITLWHENEYGSWPDRTRTVETQKMAQTVARNWAREYGAVILEV